MRNKLLRVLWGSFKLFAVLTLCIATSVVVTLSIIKGDKILNDPYTKYQDYIHPIQVQYEQEHPQTGEMLKLAGGGTSFRVKLKSGVYIMTANHICSLSQDGIVRVARDIEQSIPGDKGYEELKILKQDDASDLCLIENFKQVKYNTGLEIENKPVYPGSKTLFIGYPEGFHLYVGEGRYMGQKIIHTIEHPSIDHVKLNEFMKYELSVEEKEKICKKHGKDNLLVKQASMELFHPSFGYRVVHYHSCLMAMQVAKFSFNVSNGASGSPVINPKTGKLLTVVVIRDQGYMGYGIAPLKTDLIDFVREYNQ